MIDQRLLAEQATIQRSVAALTTEFRRVSEKVQLLTGERGGDGKPAAAVLRQNVTGLGSLSLSASAAAGAAPTKAEFDALVQDVQAINALLVRIANQLGV